MSPSLSPTSHPPKDYSFELYFSPDTQAALKVALSSWCVPADRASILSLQPSQAVNVCFVIDPDNQDNDNELENELVQTTSTETEKITLGTISLEMRLEPNEPNHPRAISALCICLWPTPQVLANIRTQSKGFHRLLVTLLENCNGLAGVLDYGDGAMETFWLPT